MTQLLPPPLINRVQPYDWRDLMYCLPANSVDAIISDPPYNTTELDFETAIDWRLFWLQARRVLRDKCNPVVLFGTQPFTTDLITSNRKGFRYEWIWSKSNGGGFLNANRQPLKRHENILVFSDGLITYQPQMAKGEPYSNRRGAAAIHVNNGGTANITGWQTVNTGDRYPTSILEYSNETGLHPTQKPVSLMRYLIQTYTTQGDVILDPFAGSGTTLVAAQELGRAFIGGDLSEQYCEVARKRLAMPFTKPMFA